MKPLLISALLLFSLQLTAQTDTAADSLATDDRVYEMFDVQTPPKFPDGEKELLRYLSQNIQYPEKARKKSTAGTVILTFVVNKDGSISDVNTVKDIGNGCGEEAARVVTAMPNWTPGELHGNVVRVRFTLPIRFTL